MQHEQNVMTSRYRAATLSAVFSLFGALAVVCPGAVHAQHQFTANPSNYQAQFSALAAGDTLLFDPGTYANGLNITGRNGTDSNWFVLKSLIPHAARFQGKAGKNTIDILNSSYVKIEGFFFDGKNIPDIDAIKAGGGGNSSYAHHIWIEDNIITGHGENQQVCGISTKIPAWDWRIDRNVIDAAGTGIYLGNSDGSMPFIRGIIEFNVIKNPTGYCMQIKHQNDRSSAPGVPGDGQTTIIRHNVFVKDDRPSPDGDRPNLLVDGQPLSGTGMNDRLELYGNFFYNNPRENLFQGTGTLSVHDNLFVNANGGVANMQPHNGRVPKEVFFYHNSIYASSTGVRLSGADTKFAQVIRGNAVFSTTPFSPVSAEDNLIGTIGDAAQYFNNPTSDTASMDFYPKAGVTAAHIDLAGFEVDSDWDRDFNGSFQNGSVYGAYAGSGTNPGWKPRVEIKTLLSDVTSVHAADVRTEGLLAYPNPLRFGSPLFLLSKADERSSIRLYDILGRELHNYTITARAGGVTSIDIGIGQDTCPDGGLLLVQTAGTVVRYARIVFLR